MNWTAPLDEYCERLGPDFWAEPVNALSNISFIVGALAAYQYVRRNRSQTATGDWLIAVLAAIGMGSFLYHTFANLWSRYADVIPIYMFQLTTIAIYGGAIGRRLGKRPALGGVVLLMVFLASVAAFSLLPKSWLNGSISYLPAWMALLLLGIYHATTCSRERFTLLWASACLAVALTFRSVDSLLCDALPMGTHWLWHGINGYTLYLVIRANVGMISESQKWFELTRS